MRLTPVMTQRATLLRARRGRRMTVLASRKLRLPIRARFAGTLAAASARRTRSLVA
jgi:hypothetical protein